MEFERNLKGFTLAEVMIVLTVIGVLTAILLPVARQSMPDENLMKFKKAHNTLGAVIRELVTSDKYYLDGDLGVKPNSDLLDGTHTGDKTYFCNTIADVVSAKKVDCKENVCLSGDASAHIAISNTRTDSWVMNLETAAAKLDEVCIDVVSQIGTGEITLPDNVVFYSVCPKMPYGVLMSSYMDHVGTPESCVDNEEFCKLRFYNSSEANSFADTVGSTILYKYYCIDIDGVGKGENPFGYGIRYDGKIIAGKRAQEWLERDVNED